MRIRSASPTWTVTAVFDPEGTARDFAYTQGLAELGHPELHAWARPTHGNDPGDDFCLSSADLCGVLNRWANRLVSGEVGPGSTRRETMDAGLSVINWELGEAASPDVVDALVLPPEQGVLPLRWTLARPTPRAVHADPLLVTERVEELRADGAPLDPAIAVDDASFGPWTDAIQLLRSSMRRADPARCITAVVGLPRLGTGHALSIATQTARWARRLDAVTAAAEAAEDDAATIAPVDESLRRQLHQLLSAVYSCWVVADVIGLAGPGARRWSEDADDGPTRRGAIAIHATALADAMAMPAAAGHRLRLHPASAAALTHAAGSPLRVVADAYSSLPMKEQQLSWSIIVETAAAGHGWLDDEFALAALGCDGPFTEQAWRAADAMCTLAASAIALAESLDRLDLEQVRELHDRLWRDSALK